MDDPLRLVLVLLLHGLGNLAGMLQLFVAADLGLVVKDLRRVYLREIRVEVIEFAAVYTPGPKDILVRLEHVLPGWLDLHAAREGRRAGDARHPLSRVHPRAPSLSEHLLVPARDGVLRGALHFQEFVKWLPMHEVGGMLLRGVELE